MLAEISDRVTGRPYCDLLEERITAPVGIDRMLGVPEAEQGAIDEPCNVGEEATPDELEAVLGVRELPITTVTPEGLISLGAPERARARRPRRRRVSRARATW